MRKLDPDRTRSGREILLAFAKMARSGTYLVLVSFLPFDRSEVGSRSLIKTLTMRETQVHTSRSFPTASSASWKILAHSDEAPLAPRPSVPSVLDPPWDASSECTKILPCSGCCT